MAPAETDVVARNPWVTRRRLTVSEYYRMAEVGILGAQERTELIEGQIVVMFPITSMHAGAVNILSRSLVLGVGDRALVSVQNPVHLDDFNEPQPDFSVLKPRDDFYRLATARPEDVLLIIEVADSSLNYDRNVKQVLYARHGIPEYWIVNLSVGKVEVCRWPEGGEYAAVSQIGRDGVLEPQLLLGVTIPVAALLG